MHAFLELSVGGSSTRSVPRARAPGRASARIGVSLLLAALPACQATAPPREPERGPGASSLPDLDAQKDATRRRLDGESPPAVPPPAPAPAPKAKPPAEASAAVAPPAAPKVAPKPAPAARQPAAPVPAPDWCDTRVHPGYPDSEFLVGLGRASVRPSSSDDPESASEEAYDRARAAAVADVLGQFETTVRAEVSSFIHQSLEAKDDEEQSRLFHAGSSRIDSVVQGQLRGIQPAARHYDPATGSACVLVAVRRADYARETAEEISVLEQKILRERTEAKAAEDEGNLPAAYRLYREAETLILASRNLRARARFAAPGQELPPGSTAEDLAEVNAAHRRVASAVDLLVLVEHEAFGKPASTSQAEEELVALLKRFGFRMKLAPTALSGKSANELIRDPSFMVRSVGVEKNPVYLLVCSLETTSRTIEEGLLRVSTEGWARLFEVSASDVELHGTASTPGGKDALRVLGTPEKQDDLVREVSAKAAANLARTIQERLSAAGS